MDEPSEGKPIKARPAQPSIDVCMMSPSIARQDWFRRSVGDAGIRIVGNAATFPLLRSLMMETSVDLVVIDLTPKVESSMVHEWLTELADQIAILALSSEPDPAIVNLLWSEKAGGMLSADASSEQLIQAMRSIASGLMVFDGALISPDAGETLSPEPLTPRESEVLDLLADGLGNKEIAHRLNISEHTIKFHIRSILGKLGATSRTEAVSRGLRSGLIEL
jgi:DNA-binding NarL/FixJ family response regulator